MNLSPRHKKIRLGISTCLLGERVRYDGGHKYNRFLVEELGRFVEYIPVCPEVECGLGIPRDPLRLVGDPSNPRLITIHTQKDFTDQMVKWSHHRIELLEKERLCGFIFKSKSPSSGMERVKVYNGKGVPVKKGIGIFAKIFMEHFPLLPVEEEGRLEDWKIRENFIERIFAMQRWYDLLDTNFAMNALVQFHSEHKLLLMSHSPKLLSALGRLVATGGTASHEERRELFQKYGMLFFSALKFQATVKKNVNVLFHAMGYFKKVLSSDEKEELLSLIQRYGHQEVPLIVPITLLQHYIRKYRQQYLASQVYFHPHPDELMLRNHV